MTKPEYTYIEFCSDPKTLWGKIASKHWDWQRMATILGVMGFLGLVVGIVALLAGIGSMPGRGLQAMALVTDKGGERVDLAGLS